MPASPRKKRKKDRKRKRSVHVENKWVRARDSILANWPFWTACTAALVIMTHNDGTPYLDAFITFVASVYLGYDLHRKTHIRNVTKFYDEMDNPIVTYIRENTPRLDAAVKWFACHGDFHVEVHHDSTVNRKPYNVLVEVYQNLLTEGLIAAALCYLLNPSATICGITIRPHIPTVVFWSLLYTSVHNINYDIIRPKEHVNHHLFPDTNFGIDLLDILCDTKHEPEGFEIMHHAVPNIVGITLLILYFRGQQT